MPRLKLMKPAASGPRLFRSDTPPVDLEDGRDAFGHKAYAVALASALLDAEAPFTFGLFGPFGLGKTTVIDELARQVKGRAAVVVFDAWRYEGDALRRQFLRDTAASLARQGYLDRSWVEKNLVELDSSSSSEQPRRGLPAIKAVAIQLFKRALPAAVLIWLAWKYAPTVGTGSKEEAQRFIASALIAAGTYVATAFSRVFYIPTESVTKGELKPELFTHKFSDMVDDLQKSERLIVVIDNLDRCSADRIEEIFFTLNTFLEPLGVPYNRRRLAIGKNRRRKEAVFLIAADDQALRKHLNAKESLASRDTLHAFVERGDTGSYADEYLRKIFKASISMKQILADDMRDFVGQELAAFCTMRALNDHQRATLVQLVSAALKSNPRRIREFGNNLELQLRMIEARESDTDPQIRPAISGDVLLIAKMRLLEEEWPRSYKLIYGDPRLLATWYENMEASQYPNMPDAGDVRFIAFMNIARSIRDKNLRALLRLKQSWEEVRLPRSVEFHDALVEGQSEVVAEIVGAEGADPKAYALRLHSILAEELERLYLAGARNLIEVALTVEPLQGYGDEISRLLITAADSQPLRQELRNASVEPLFAAMEPLDDGHLNQLMEPWVSLHSFYEESPDRAKAVAESLVSVLPRLSSKRRGELSDSLRDERLKNSISTYLALVEADPELTLVESGAFAVERLGERFATTSEPFRLFRAWLQRSELALEPQDAFAELVATRLDDPSELENGALGTAAEQLEAVATVLRELKSLSKPEQLQTACLNAFPSALSAGAGESLLDVADAALAREAPSAQAVAEQLVALYYNHENTALFAYALRRAGALSESLDDAVMKQMETALLNTALDAKHRLAAAEVIAALDPRDKRELIGASVYQLVNKGDWSMADTLLTRYPNRAERYRADTADSALKRVQAEGRAISEEAYPLFARIVSDFDDHELSRLRNTLDDMITAGDAEDARKVIEVADDFARVSTGFSGQRETLIRELFDSFASTATPPASLPELVAERADVLDPDRRASLVSQLVRWIHQPGDHQLGAARAAAKFKAPSGSERSTLIDAIIEAETAAAADRLLRRGLLKAAYELQGRKGSIAAKRFAGRIRAITSERSEENQLLLQELDLPLSTDQSLSDAQEAG
jgi:hypothetical protein